MGKTVVRATLTGDLSSREYDFLVDTGSTLVGLPADEIRALGLRPIPNGRIRVRTANGIVERNIFNATAQVMGKGIGANAIEAPVPLIGYELLENIRLKVNPVTQRLEHVPDDEMGPPYQISSWV